jgi:hypothetical protein
MLKPEDIMSDILMSKDIQKIRKQILKYMKKEFTKILKNHTKSKPKNHYERMMARRRKNVSFHM